MNTVKRTEKGWAGHFICSRWCLFRRHTLLEYGDIAITVSTVGNHLSYDEKMQDLGIGRYFETMVFHSEPVTVDNHWKDADVSKQIAIRSRSTIGEPWKEQEANDMHERIVQEFVDDLLAGNRFEIPADDYDE